MARIPRKAVGPMCIGRVIPEHVKDPIVDKGPVTQAQTQGLRMDRVQFPTFARVLRYCRF